MAYREVSPSEYAEWSQLYDNAAAQMSGRVEALDRAAEIIERDLQLLGATAIEDKLQDGVPDAIHTLQQAGIKVRIALIDSSDGAHVDQIWVLTGDRQETAINIGLSCRLISEAMNLVRFDLLYSEHAARLSKSQVIINTETLAETVELLNRRLFAIKNQRLGGDVEELALIIGAYALEGLGASVLTSRRWQKFDFCPRKGLFRCFPRARDHVQGQLSPP